MAGTLVSSNVIFDSVSGSYIAYVGSNINITSANTVINGRLVANNAYANAFYGSNTSYYFNPAATSYVNRISTNDFIMSGTNYISPAGLGSMLLLQNNGTTNKLFTAAHNNGTVVYYGLARGGSGYNVSYGLDNFRVVNFPNETAGPIQVGGTYQVCFALFANGNLYTWGLNQQGQCGVGSTTVVPNPVLAATSVTNVWEHYSQINYTSYTRLFIKKSDGYIYAAGYNGYGQLGDTTTVDKTSFTQLTNLGTTVTSVWPIGAQYGYTFFQKSDQTIWACGYNGYGQLGNAGVVNQSTPVNVTTNWGGATGYVIQKVIGFGGLHNGGATAYGTAGIFLDNGTTSVFRTCGYGVDGELGNGGVVSISTPATPNIGGARISDVTTWGDLTFGLLTTGGTFYQWGYNGNGQFGNGNTTLLSTPTSTTTGVLQMFGGNSGYATSQQAQAFVRKSDGLYATGYNGYGELGVGDVTQRTAWTKVLLPADFTVSKLGSYSTNNGTRTYLAIGTDGRMFAWGYNGQNDISQSTTTTVLTPIQIKLPLGA